MSMLEWVAVVLVVVMILIPPKYDPAIKLKEWSERNEHD